MGSLMGGSLIGPPIGPMGNGRGNVIGSLANEISSKPPLACCWLAAGNSSQVTGIIRSSVFIYHLIWLLAKSVNVLAEPETVARFWVNIPNGYLRHGHIGSGLTAWASAVDLLEFVLP